MAFVKGMSGNPGGRPKASAEMKLLAQQHGKKALATLVKMLDSEDERNRFAASVALLDRGFGKPAQAITGGDEDDPPIRMISMTDAEIIKRFEGKNA